MRPTSIINILIFALFPFLAIADGTPKSTSDTLVPVALEPDSFVLQPDDPVLLAMDKILAEQYFIATDKNHPFDSTLLVNDEYIQQELEALNHQTPFNLVYNKNVASFINLYVNKRKSLVGKMIGLSEIYFPMFEEMLDKYDIPLEMKYLAVVESALNPTAKSRVGARGLWQFMYSTGKMYGLQSTSYVEDRNDPYLATEAACKYLKYLHSLYDNWELAMAAYNCGPGNVNKAIRRSGGKKNYWKLWPYLPRETRGYVPAFIAVNYAFTHAEQHGITVQKPQTNYFNCDTVHVNEEVYFSQIAEALVMDIEMIQFLNPRYKLNYIPNNGKCNALCLPKDKIGAFLYNERLVYNYNEPTIEEKLKAEREKVEMAEKTQVHIVKNGEYLGLIAGKYHVGVSQIKSWNNLRSNNLKIGQKLIIYSNNYTASTSKQKVKIDANATYYTIKSGDTLWDVAQAKKISVTELKKLNANLNFNKLKPGTKIVVKKG